MDSVEQQSAEYVLVRPSGPDTLHLAMGRSYQEARTVAIVTKPDQVLPEDWALIKRVLLTLHGTHNDGSGSAS